MAIIGVLKRNTCHIEECNANPYKSTRWQDQQLENIAKDKGKTEAIGLGNRQPKNTNPNGVARSDFGRRGIRRFASGCTLSIVTNMDLAFGNIIGSVFRRLSVLVRPDSGRPVGTSIHDGWPRSQAVGLIVQAKYSIVFENLVQKNRNNLRNLACVGVQTKVSEFLVPFFCGSHIHRVKRSFESSR